MKSDANKKIPYNATGKESHQERKYEANIRVRGPLMYSWSMRKDSCQARPTTETHEPRKVLRLIIEKDLLSLLQDFNYNAQNTYFCSKSQLDYLFDMTYDIDG